MTASIKTAVFPLAGLGTRFLPATKAVPKEMLPVVDRPLIQYAVEEAREAGCEHFVFVVGNHNRALLEAHFRLGGPLEELLAERGKAQEVEIVRAAGIDPAHIHFAVQDKPLGLGHAVWCAREFVDGPFAVILPDDMVLAETGCLKQMAKVHAEKGGNVVAVEDVPRERTNRYGILDVTEDDGRIAQAKGLVEKPDPAEAPSTLSIIGRYILDSSVFSHLERKMVGAGGEIQLTDAIAATIGEVPFHGLRFEGKRFDCGSKAGFLEANVAYALADAEMAGDVRTLLKGLS